MRQVIRSAGLVAALAVAGSAVPVHAAEVYGFGCFVVSSPSEVANCAIAQAQLSVEIAAAGPDRVLFTFRNAGPAASSITDIYFDDGTLLGLASVQNPPAGVRFEQDASPSNLPGGNALDPPFRTSTSPDGMAQEFSVQSAPPTQPNGVNPGEWVGVLFTLQAGRTFEDTLAALATGGVPGGLRIGLRVQGFADGGSVSVVNAPTPVPVPAAAPLLLAGLAGLAGLARRRDPALR